MLRARVLAVLWKDLGQESQQEDPYQDGHVGNQHGGVGGHWNLNFQLSVLSCQLTIFKQLQFSVFQFQPSVVVLQRARANPDRCIRQLTTDH